MAIFKKRNAPAAIETHTSGNVIVQTARQSEPHDESLNFDGKYNGSRYETELYEALRYCIPVIDAALSKIIRLTGGYHIICDEEELQPLVDDFVRNVSVGYTQRGLSAFTDAYLDSLLTYGNAAGEILIDEEKLIFAGLYNANASDLEVKKGNSPLEKTFFRREYDLCSQEQKIVKILRPERILFTPLSPKNGEIYGRSLLQGLPSLSKILLKIYQSVGQNYERCGNVRYAVVYKPPSDGSERAYTKERAERIAEEWASGMRSAGSGQVRDFICAGDVDIKVIGADNKMLDTQVPVRQILEQLLSKLSIPPFLLGLSWSTTERMSSQQTDILTSELDYYRRLIEPIIVRVTKIFLNMNGYKSNVRVEWDTVNLQDETELSQARLNNAKAAQIENLIRLDSKN